MKALVMVGALALVGCKHEPETKPVVELSDVKPGELMLGIEGAKTPEEIVQLATGAGFKAEYVAAASETTHLVRFTRDDGSALDAEATAALQKELAAKKAFRFVELNRLRQPK